MVLQDAGPNRFSRMQDARVGHRTAEWSAQCNDRSDILRTLPRDRARNHYTSTVSDQMHSATSFLYRLIDGVIQASLYKQVRTLGVDGHARKKWLVSDAL